jgi:hypothetical protein
VLAALHPSLASQLSAIMAKGWFGFEEVAERKRAGSNRRWPSVLNKESRLARIIRASRVFTFARLMNGGEFLRGLEN